MSAPHAAMTGRPRPLALARGRCALVVNPFAWTNLRSPERRRVLARAFAPLGDVVETEDPAALPALFARWKAEGRDMIGVCGGDGTVNAAVNALVAVWGGEPLPRLLLLHGGTYGLVTRTFGADPVRLVAALAAGAPACLRRVDVLTVGDRLAFTFGVGLFAALPAEFVRRGARGPAAVRSLGLSATASALFGGALARRILRGWPGEARLDGRARPAEAGLYVASVDAPLHLPAVDAVERPAGWLRVLRVAGGPAGGGFARLARCAVGLGGAVTGEAARCVEVRPEGPVAFMVDGEVGVLGGLTRVCVGRGVEVVGVGCHARLG